MKVSDLEKLCAAVREKIGDLDVAILTDTPDGMFHADLEPNAAVIQLPDDYDESKPGMPIFAIAWPEALPESDTPDALGQIMAAVKKPKLEVVT